jgi:hypothetical protein
MNEEDTLPPRAERAKIRPIVLVCWVAFVLLLVFLGARSAHAGPIYRAAGGGITITLYSEKCALEAIGNLPKRAVWLESGKPTEGCWGVSPFGFIVFYFSDRTATAVPPSEFHKVEES